MKGLWIKDFALLKLQKNFFIIIFGICIATIFFNQNADFILGFLPFLMVISALSTMNYDEDHNSISYLMTLPIQRKTYVYEKYAFVLTISGFTICIATLINILYAYTQHITLPLEYFFLPLTILFSLVILVSISLPFQIKYGAQRGRIGMMVCFGLFFLFLVIISKILTSLEIDPSWILSQINLPIFSFGILFLLILIPWISIRTSVHIIENKEF